MAFPPSSLVPFQFHTPMPHDEVDVRDRVAQVTSALAPFLLPMIESVSELDEGVEYFSESAGQAA